ncbi:hypothetical protein E2C01_069555 [Portunus trituberculatus]|uniref:Uncharacterized protein n=1 Tax=Portunus trituberculatus TaxID=210409 RepID=A0A5B7HUV1_PORTR|nr:hypothetical protein [Portunus trituberculatus]
MAKKNYSLPLRLRKLFLLLGQTTPLISASSSSPSTGENPSYRECQPHIDATIRNLAAKAIVAGETPSEDIKPEDYGRRTSRSF